MLRIANRNGKHYDLSGQTIELNSGSNKTYKYTITHDNYLVVSGVQNMPICVSLSKGKRKASFVLFPYVRGTSPDVAVYSIRNVNLDAPLAPAD